MADTLNLLPCPFCGTSEADVCERDGLHFVMCAKCTAEGPAMEGTQSRLDASKEWNRRASSAAAVPVDALPPLPEPFGLMSANDKDGFFSPHQMQAYARAAVEADRA